MKLALLFFAFSFAAWGQQPAPAPAPLSTWIGAGGGFLNPGGMFFGMFATPVSSTAGLHSWTAEQFTPVKHAPPTMATNTGLYWDVRTIQFGDYTVTLGLLGAPGVSTSSTATTFSLSDGGGLLIANSRWGKFALWIGGLQHKDASTNGTKIEMLMSVMYRIGQ